MYSERYRRSDILKSGHLDSTKILRSTLYSLRTASSAFPTLISRFPLYSATWYDFI